MTAKEMIAEHEQFYSALTAEMNKELIARLKMGNTTESTLSQMYVLLFGRKAYDDLYRATRRKQDAKASQQKATA